MYFYNGGISTGDSPVWDNERSLKYFFYVLFLPGIALAFTGYRNPTHAQLILVKARPG